MANHQWEAEPEAPDHGEEAWSTTAVWIYDALCFLGFILLLLTLLPAVFSKRVTRRRAWYSFVSSWIVFAFSYVLLVHNQFENTPHFGTCLMQVLLVYSAPSLVACTGVAFILDTLFLVRTVVLGNQTKYQDLIIIMPWIAWTLLIISTSFLIGEPEQIAREPTHMYCHSKSSAPLIVTLCITFPLTAICIVLELWLAYFLTVHWTAFRRYTNSPEMESHTRSISMIMRLAVFMTMPIGALGLATYIASHDKESTITWNILLVTLPIMAAVTFGTQKDILHVYWCRPLARHQRAKDVGYKQIELGSQTCFSGPSSRDLSRARNTVQEDRTNLTFDTSRAHHAVPGVQGVALTA